jgi:predicted Zn-dependent peptidase
METTNYPLDMDMEEWDTVVEYLEQGILEPAFTQKTVELGDTVVSVGRGCPVV